MKQPEEEVSFAHRGPCICGAGHTESHFSLKVKLMNHGKVLHSIHIDEEIFFAKPLDQLNAVLGYCS